MKVYAKCVELSCSHTSQTKRHASQVKACLVETNNCQACSSLQDEQNEQLQQHPQHPQHQQQHRQLQQRQTSVTRHAHHYISPSLWLFVSFPRVLFCFPPQNMNGVVAKLTVVSVAAFANAGVRTWSAWPLRLGYIRMCLSCRNRTHCWQCHLPVQLVTSHIQIDMAYLGLPSPNGKSLDESIAGQLPGLCPCLLQH